MTKRTKTTKNILHWARETGARIENFQVAKERFDDRETSREIVATKDVHEGDELCFIPTALLLSETHAKESIIGQSLIGKIEHLDVFSERYPHAVELICMAIFMVYEKVLNPESHWKPYLDSLPLKYNLPICWDEKDWKLLEGTNLFSATQKRKKWLRDVHEVVGPLLMTVFDRKLEYEELLWGYCSILSRAFPKARNDAGEDQAAESDWITLSEICMYPALDMLNHDRNAKIDWVPTKDGVSYIARQFFQKGKPLFLSYGPKGNENLLSNYGFVLQDNPEDYYKIFLNVRKEDPLYEKRIQIIERLQLKRDYMIFNNDERLSEPLELTTCILIANEVELEQLEQSSAYRTNRMKFVMWHTLWCLMKQKLEEINPIGGEFDKERTQLAMVYRNGQKMILEHAIRLVEQLAVELLRGDAKHCIVLSPDHPQLDKEYGSRCIASYEALTQEQIDEDTLYCIHLVHQLSNPSAHWYSQLHTHFNSIGDIERCLG
jgi:hypothetical protein